jgi:alkylation response protein AidB-like acyl-CoA dehydrogenase
MNYADQAAALARHLAIMPFRAELAAARGEEIDDALWESIVDEAAAFAQGVLDPLGEELDRAGVRLDSGQVHCPPAHHAAWARYREMGWLGMAAPAPDGQGLPLALVSACEELFNRASVAFHMLMPATRTAASLIARAAPAPVAAQWVPRLLSGEWVGTICISEPDAGSDVGRIRTRARPAGESWRVTGEKCWISYGGHDLTPRIGHMALARTSDAPGVRGLSLFLVPSTRDDGGANGVVVRRIEHKLGLHGSPTCQLGFEEAEAVLLGEEGRGLAAMLHMMLLMRLSCGPQGTGVAAAAFATALAYARDRRQGGPAEQPPLPIVAHADVRRQLLDMAAAVELTRALNLAAATALELGDAAPDPAARARWTDLAQFLLPLVKDGGARAAFDVASGAIQVLGGAGYTREWPVERLLRDSRVFAVFEGATGIQAADVLHRRVRREGRPGFAAFLDHAREEAGAAPGLARALAILEEVADAVSSPRARADDGDAGAVALLDLCTAVAHGWMAARIDRLAGDDAVGARLRAAARFWLAELPIRCEQHARLALLGAARLDGLAPFLA